MKSIGYKGNVDTSNYIRFCRMFNVIDADIGTVRECADAGYFYCPYIPLQFKTITRLHL